MSDENNSNDDSDLIVVLISGAILLGSALIAGFADRLLKRKEQEALVSAPKPSRSTSSYSPSYQSTDAHCPHGNDFVSCEKCYYGD